MSDFHIIPAIDLYNGRVVRLTQGNYDECETFDLDPVVLAKRFEKAGAKRIHIVDLNGAKEGHLVNASVITQIRRSVDCEIELGGGIRNQKSIDLLFDLGINYVILGSLLIKDMEESQRLISDYPGRIIAGLDAKDDVIAVEGWRESSSSTVDSVVKRLNKLPLSAIIYTDIAKDGMLSGPNFSAIESLLPKSNAPIIASGGVHTLKDIEQLAHYYSKGLFGCIIGKAILKNTLSLTSIFSL
ncbi:MAG: 1-(5-phosphoribosyl)-5-[(5-phosphoribosylamino)methylideneamino]imidazole-4-carboxamide isomerase [bacterium]